MCGAYSLQQMSHYSRPAFVSLEGGFVSHNNPATSKETNSHVWNHRCGSKALRTAGTGQR